MRTQSTLLLVTGLFLPSAQAVEWHAGAGLGPDYAGVGAKLSVTSRGNGLALGLGCSSYNSDDGTQCGASFSAVNTRWFDPDQYRHGVALYAGLVDDKLVARGDNQEFELEQVYGVGIGYHYYHNGIDQPGLQLGLYLSRENDLEKETLLRWQVGYQF